MRLTHEEGIPISSQFRLIPHKSKIRSSGSKIDSIIQNVLLIPNNAKKLIVYPGYAEFPASLLKKYNLVENNQATREKFRKSLALKEDVYYIRGSLESLMDKEVPKVPHNIKQWAQNVEWVFNEYFVVLINIAEIYKSHEEYMNSVRDEVVNSVLNDLFPKPGKIIEELEKLEQPKPEKDEFQEIVEKTRPQETDSDDIGDLPT